MAVENCDELTPSADPSALTEQSTSMKAHLIIILLPNTGCFLTFEFGTKKGSRRWSGMHSGCLKEKGLRLGTHTLFIAPGLTHAKGHKRWSGICTKQKGGVICSKAKIDDSSMRTHSLSIKLGLTNAKGHKRW